jgi:hypothetical protein
MVTADERITDGRNRSIASQGHRFVKMERVFVAIITRERRDPDNPFGPLRSRLLPAASSQPAAGLSWALVARADERPKPPAGAVMMNHRRWFGPEAGERKPPDVLSPALDAASSRRLCARIVPRSGDLILRISRPVQCRQGRRRIWAVGCFAEAVAAPACAPSSAVAQYGTIPNFHGRTQRTARAWKNNLEPNAVLLPDRTLSSGPG